MTLASLLLGAAVLAALELFWFWAASWRRRARARRPPAPPPGAFFLLGGRRFWRIENAPVFVHEHVHRVLLAAGIAEPELLPGETPAAYVDRIFVALHQAKADRPLVAAALWPADRSWPTSEEDFPRVAGETAAFLGALDREKDKSAYYALLGDILRPFSMRGLGSWLRFGISGSREATMPSPPPATSPAPAAAAGRE